MTKKYRLYAAFSVFLLLQLSNFRLHKPNEIARFYNNELIETNMDDIEAYKVNKLYQANVKYMEKD